ncbi:MAG: class I SAM-dependent DNA methyltransferase [Candidatus Gastranaerophilales bacterium]|nr:class I SAM-dependent DNA methyltransferase [Candidatus Gastranaerophilales bacterium]
MIDKDFTTKTKELIDGLKSTCANFGLGNDGNEFKIITQIFLYKFINDKFGYEVKKIDQKLAKADEWEEEIAKYSDNEYELLLMQLPESSAQLKKEHYLSHLYSIQNEADFAKTFDDTLRDIAIFNTDIFSVKTESGAKVTLFDELTNFITDPSQRNNFARALINKLINFNFESVFNKKYDFFATIFEYLIKDYNTDSGGKYAEYYTPHSVARVMAEILVDKNVSNVKCYDPSAGSGTLLMCLAHEIGEDKCSIFSQDISQKSSGMLRLNLILNNLVHSIQNIIQGNTILKPEHKENDNTLRKFDYVVSNPPFKLDFSDYRDDLDTKANKERFFAGIPNVPNKKKESMAIYLMFLQHIIYSLKDTGKAAVVVPTGFITAQSGIELKIRQKLVDEKMLKGVVSMPSNIFASTGTNVSVIFIDKTNKDGNVILVDASKLGIKIKEDGKNQKTVLSDEEEQKIINIFKKQKEIEDLSVIVTYDTIKKKNYSFSAGQYFEIKIDSIDITHEEFKEKMDSYKSNLNKYFVESNELQKKIQIQLDGVLYE